MGPALRFLGPHVDKYRRATNTNRLVGQTPVALALLLCIVAQGKPVISTGRDWFAARTAHSHQQLANPKCSWRWWDKCPTPLCTSLPFPQWSDRPGDRRYFTSANQGGALVWKHAPFVGPHCWRRITRAAVTPCVCSVEREPIGFPALKWHLPPRMTGESRASSLSKERLLYGEAGMLV